MIILGGIHRQPFETGLPKNFGENNVSGSSFNQHVTRAPNTAGFHGALFGV